MTHHCEQHGTDYNVDHLATYVVEPWTGYVGCPRCDIEAKERRFVERARKADIPTRFAGKEFEAFVVSNPGMKRALEIARHYVENFKDHLAAGRCLVFCGKPGTGKTLLSSIIGTSLIRGGRAVKYTTVPVLIRNLRSSWNGGGGLSENEQLQTLQGLDLLILDEVGLQLGTDSELQHLTEVLDLRYQKSRPSLVISNYSLSEMSKFLGDRGVDRLKDNGGVVVIFNWASHRGQNADRV